MEEFYQLLRKYNYDFSLKENNLPSWFLQFTEPGPPLYWKTVFEILYNENRNKSIVEIGSGYGNITALLHFMGFQKIISFERSEKLTGITQQKVQDLFGKQSEVINKDYPQNLNFVPDILIQVNCIYPENISCKHEYINQIKNTYEANGKPATFIVEFIDSSFKMNHLDYPDYVRMNEFEVSEIFPDCSIQSFETYKYPFNKTSKRIYVICK
jgi:protein-L-isoaspartate(D-aspartate) O-methyltransferase